MKRLFAIFEATQTLWLLAHESSEEYNTRQRALFSSPRLMKITRVPGVCPLERVELHIGIKWSLSLRLSGELRTGRNKVRAPCRRSKLQNGDSPPPDRVCRSLPIRVEYKRVRLWFIGCATTFRALAWANVSTFVCAGQSCANMHVLHCYSAVFNIAQLLFCIVILIISITKCNLILIILYTASRGIS